MTDMSEECFNRSKQRYYLNEAELELPWILKLINFPLKPVNSPSRHYQSLIIITMSHISCHPSQQYLIITNLPIASDDLLLDPIWGHALCSSTFYPVVPYYMQYLYWSLPFSSLSLQPSIATAEVLSNLLHVSKSSQTTSLD